MWRQRIEDEGCGRGTVPIWWQAGRLRRLGDKDVDESAGWGCWRGEECRARSRGMVFGVFLEGWKDYRQCVYAFCRSPVQCTAMCVCVPVSEAGDGEQWSEGDAVTRGEVVSARVLHSSTT